MEIVDFGSVLMQTQDVQDEHFGDRHEQENETRATPDVDRLQVANLKEFPWKLYAESEFWDCVFVLPAECRID